MSHEPTVKRWTAKRKAAVVIDIFKGKATVAEAAKEHNLTVSEIESRNLATVFRRVLC